MLHIWMIAIMGMVVLQDSAAGPTRSTPAGEFSWWMTGLALSQFVVIGLLTQLVCWACGRVVDRSGSHAALRATDRMIEASRVLAVLAHAVSVFALGWVGQVRAVVGDVIILDEFLAILPAVLTFAAAWWSYYPIEARLRGTTWIRILENGDPAYPTQTRWQYVWSSVRHHMLLTLVPLMLIGGWAESVDWMLARMAGYTDPGPVGGVSAWLRGSEDRVAMAGGIARLAGVAAIFVLSPLIMRYVWDTVRLDGDLRTRLLELCERAGVRVRELLIWRTHGTMINGAAMGLVAPLRYILLTDALLDHMPQKQVESVMAHEIGHARHHHIAWLVLGLLACVGVAGAAMSVAMLTAVNVFLPSVSEGRVAPPWWLASPESLLMPPTLLIAFLGFGMISRRFEWQADAFAVQQLARETPGNSVVTEEAAEAMGGALAMVSRLNHVPQDSWSFRHGSIRTRRRKLASLVGRRLDELPIDRTVRWVKGLIIAGLVIVAGVMAWELSLDPERIMIEPPALETSPRPTWETDP